MTDDTFVTLGRVFRTPAHPDVLSALGRALYNFLALEEILTALFDEADHLDPPVSRGMMAGGKAAELRRLVERYRSPGGDESVAAILDEALNEFNVARKEVRNQLLHAHPFASDPDEVGTTRPALPTP